MNWDQVEGNWKEFSGKIRKQWGKLTDDDLEQAKGSRDQLIGRIQQHYGDTKEQVEKDLDKLLS